MKPEVSVIIPAYNCSRTIKQAIEDFRGGKEKALGALVGQTMKAMKGKADPASVNQMLRELLK